jgi:8-oxo-dGTP pyrophosphatase MutT (NUDIX family)
MTRHSGQISFPGGSRDADDEDLVATALREAQEELGLSVERAQVLGILPPVFTVVSNFLITPVVSWLGEDALHLVPNAGEVAEVIEISLPALADPTAYHEEVWPRAGREVTVHFYDVDGYRIWGATARILHDFLALLPA